MYVVRLRNRQNTHSVAEVEFVVGSVAENGFKSSSHSQSRKGNPTMLAK